MGADGVDEAGKRGRAGGLRWKQSGEDFDCLAEAGGEAVTASAVRRHPHAAHLQNETPQIPQV